MTDSIPTRRWLHLTLDRFVVGLLVVEGLLWLSERYGWFWFNENKGWTVLVAVAVVGGAMVVVLGWFIVALVFRWRFQFSLRSLLLLVVAVALSCSWLAVEMKAAKREREAAEAIEKLDGVLYWSEPAGPVWLRSLLGEHFFQHVDQLAFTGADLTDDDLKHHLCELHQLRLLSFKRRNKVTDAGIETL